MDIEVYIVLHTLQGVQLFCLIAREAAILISGKTTFTDTYLNKSLLNWIRIRIGEFQIQKSTSARPLRARFV